MEKRRRTERLENFASPETVCILVDDNVPKHCLYGPCKEKGWYCRSFLEHRAEFHRKNPDMKKEIKQTKICAGEDCNLCIPVER